MLKKGEKAIILNTPSSLGIFNKQNVYGVKSIRVFYASRVHETQTMALITTNNLTKSYGATDIFAGITISIEKGFRQLPNKTRID